MDVKEFKGVWTSPSIYVDDTFVELIDAWIKFYKNREFEVNLAACINSEHIDGKERIMFGEWL